MARVTICSDFGAQENKVSHLVPLFFHLFVMKWRDWMPWPVFWMLSFKPTFSLSSFTIIKRLFSSSLLSAIRVVSSAYLRLFLPPILIPAYNSSSLAFLMMCSAHRLNKRGGSRQPCHTPVSTLNQSVVPYRLLTVAPWPTYRFLRRQVRWSGIPIPLRAFHSLLWSTQSNALA